MQRRLISLDTFRGATIALMIFVDNLSGDFFRRLEHAPWDGWTFADTIFPFFLWIMGMAIVFSFSKRAEQKEHKKSLFFHILLRSLILFAIGLFINGYPLFNLSTIRILGILQRIALCYFFAGIITLTTSIRIQILLTGILLIFYWLIIKLVPVPGYGAGVLDRNGNLVQYVDLLLLKGHMYSAGWDPEGILSTIPAIASTLFGVVTGQFLLGKKNDYQKALLMFFAGVGLLIAGRVMEIWLPINKNLWTSSYAIFMAGLATISFSVLYFVIEVLNYKKLFKPLVVFGTNAIAIYVLSSLITKTFWSPSLIFATTHVALLFIIAFVMYRKRWFIKI